MTLGTIAGYKSAIGLFEQVPDWEDSSSLVLQCQERIVSLYKAEKDRCERLEEQKRIAAEKGVYPDPELVALTKPEGIINNR